MKYQKSPIYTVSSPVSSQRQRRSQTQQTIVIIYLLIIFVAGVLLLHFFSGRMMIGGVPSSIVIRFLQDDIARTAYLSGDNKLLHDRLDDMGIERDMKDFYRPQIADEAELDQYIHQILYDRTGYIGAAYEVNGNGVLVLRD